MDKLIDELYELKKTVKKLELKVEELSSDKKRSTYDVLERAQPCVKTQQADAIYTENMIKKLDKETVDKLPSIATEHSVQNAIHMASLKDIADFTYMGAIKDNDGCECTAPLKHLSSMVLPTKCQFDKITTLPEVKEISIQNDLYKSALTSLLSETNNSDNLIWKTPPQVGTRKTYEDAAIATHETAEAIKRRQF